MTEAAITEAVAQLRDDPSFRLFPAEQEKEATAALKRAGHPEPDDALAVALVIDGALNGPASVAPSADRDDDVCGRTVTEGEPNGKPACATPALAANGRCMECGARRALPKPEAVMASSPAVATPMDALFLDGLIKTGGFGQAELAKVLGCSRQSVGFYASGKVAWEPGPQTLSALHKAVVDRVEYLALAAGGIAKAVAPK